MNNLIRRDLQTRAAAGLVLMLVGAATFALTAQDSWIALTGLLASLAGLALLYRVVRLGRGAIAARMRLGTGSSSVPLGCAIVLVRVGLILALLIGGGTWLWFAGVDMN